MKTILLKDEGGLRKEGSNMLWCCHPMNSIQRSAGFLPQAWTQAKHGRAEEPPLLSGCSSALGEAWKIAFYQQTVLDSSWVEKGGMQRGWYLRQEEQRNGSAIWHLEAMLTSTFSSNDKRDTLSPVGQGKQWEATCWPHIQHPWNDTHCCQKPRELEIPLAFCRQVLAGAGFFPWQIGDRQLKKYCTTSGFMT